MFHCFLKVFTFYMGFGKLVYLNYGFSALFFINKQRPNSQDLNSIPWGLIV
jgi:hypothetical protein